MIKPPANQDEFEQLQNYFWDRLGEDMKPTTREASIITLSKPAAYQARKALRAINTPDELVLWARQWLTDGVWQRARSRVRAKRYRERNDLVRASITADIKTILDARAKAMDMPLWAYLQELALDTQKLEELEQSAGLRAPGESL